MAGGNMTNVFRDEIGSRFGRLTVVSRAENGPGGKPRWMCICDCGAGKVVRGGNLRQGNVLSCGCARSERLAEKNRATAIHGMTGSSSYISWRSMNQRCDSKTGASFQNYGARGIAVCPEWRDSFPTFLADMGQRPEGKTLDRIDNDLGYFAANCRWATFSEQALNRRRRSRKSEQARVIRGAYLKTRLRVAAATEVLGGLME